MSRDVDRSTPDDREHARRVERRAAIINAHLELAIAAVSASLESGWIGPEHSPLGAAAHEAAARRRIARWRMSGGGPADATIVAGRPLLTIDAVVDEYFGPPPASNGERLERALAALRRHRPHNDNG